MAGPGSVLQNQPAQVKSRADPANFMGQRLHLIRSNKYRLMIKSLSDNERSIGTDDSKFNFRLLIKDKFSNPPLESYEANIVKNVVGFDLDSKLEFGTYLYVIESISKITKETVDELVYGFVEIYADVVEIMSEDAIVEIFKSPAQNGPSRIE
jgi:hypothetical protein